MNYSKEFKKYVNKSYIENYIKSMNGRKKV